VKPVVTFYRAAPSLPVPMPSAGGPGLTEGCEIRLDRVDYRADQPQFVDGPETRAVVGQAFGPAERAMFRVLGIRQHLLLHRAAS
jgi:hypothetical protein